MHHLCPMKKNCLFLLVLFILCGCRKIVDVPRPPKDPELVLFANMDQLKTDVFVTETRSEEERDVIDGLSDVIVKIEGPEGNIFTIPNFQDGNYYANFQPESGKPYILTAEKNGFEIVQSTVTLPPPVDLLSLEIELLDSIRLDSSKVRYFYQFDIQLEKQNDEIEYYEVNSVFPAKILVDSNFHDGVRIPEILPTPNTNTIELDYRGQFFVSNVDSNKISFGSAFDLRTGEFLKKVQIEVKSSNLENYEYANSLSNLRKFDDGELITLDPIELYSNVENGRGFFAAHQTDTISKKIPR